MTIFLLIGTSLLPVLLSVMLTIAEKVGWLKKIKYWPKQIAIGLLFGGIAVISTEYGIKMDEYVLNARDAAPLCAGLIFGGPAGIIAGCIGGIERWFAVYWGVGYYTRVACSIATTLAGFIGAGLRVWLFNDKRPSWIHGLAIGMSMEVLHMLMVFITNMSDVAHAFDVVQNTALYMIPMNSISVALAVLITGFIVKEKKRGSIFGIKKISQTFQQGILICVILAFAITSIFTFALQTQLSFRDYTDLMLLNINDVKHDIDKKSDERLLKITHDIAAKLNEAGLGNADLRKLTEDFNVSEINIVNDQNVITGSSNSAFVGYDMNSGEQSSKFSVLNEGYKEFVQPYQPISYDSETSMKYAGAVLKDGGYVQVGYDADGFRDDIKSLAENSTLNRHVGKNGFMIITSQSGEIVSGRSERHGSKLLASGIRSDSEVLSSGERFTATVYGVKSQCVSVYAEGYYIIGVIPMSEVVFTRNISTYILAFMEIVVFTALFIQIYYLIKSVVVDNIEKVNDSLAKITGGDLDTRVSVRSNEEFISLSNDINLTVSTLKEYIEQAAARIDQELEFAKSIQHSALPSVFPPYPDRRDFDIYALMDTAKEVGGDFYDFYLIDGNRLVFMIADVSGKGIPAAMFMMTAKTQIKSLVESGMPADKAFFEANNKLCESNETGMFVTAWMGMLDLGTGKIDFVNAGHNPPLIRHRGGSFEYLRTRPNFVLAGMEDAKYRINELQLKPGDEIFLYTDGVPESTKEGGELWGEERLQALLGANEFESLKAECDAVMEGINDFVGDADQFDDITMVALKTNWFQSENSITAYPDMASVEKVAAFAEEYMDKSSVPIKLTTRLMVAIDEIYSNIVRYSGADTATMQIDKNDVELTMTFTDNGKPYDPTQNEDPDVTADLEEREIGGLGIFMVRSMAKTMEYERRDDRNVLTTVFELENFRKPAKK